MNNNIQTKTLNGWDNTDPPNTTKSKKSQKQPRKTRRQLQEQQLINALQAKNGSALAGFVNPTASQREIVMTVKDYFDVTHAREAPFAYYFNNKQAVFTDTFASGENFIRIRKATFYALPKFNNNGIDSSATTLLVAYNLPVEAIGYVDYNTAEQDQKFERRAACQKTTVMTPTSIYDWVKVGIYTERVLRSTLASPAFQESGSGENVTTGQLLGVFAVLNPDDGSYSNQTVQFMVELELTVTVPLAVTFEGGVGESYTNSWLYPIGKNEGGSDWIPLGPTYISVRGSRQAN